MDHKSFDLVILAAGMGSRFGGLKQVQPVGPAGELIIEYSVFDALRAGFDRVVLVIRKEIEDEFRATIGRRLERRIAVDYVFQDLADVPVSSAAFAARTKPWGTAHAVWVTRKAVARPFAVINADDFYGATGYRVLAGHFARPGSSYALVGYQLRQTLSEHGAVSRGVCRVGGDDRLQQITEVTNIEADAGGARYVDAAGAVQRLTGDEIVSMNFWGFTPAVFEQIETTLAEFLRTRGADPKSEFYLPTTLSALNERGAARIELLRSSEAWFGLTYRQDLAAAQSAIGELIRAGRYPSPLWAAE
ncbi:MAG: NTP transferase domain-containing protein [Opitutae bacterium]|nr:NTP transferase domain-containing protein [Opitutae bacterium]